MQKNKIVVLSVLVVLLLVGIQPVVKAPIEHYSTVYNDSFDDLLREKKLLQIQYQIHSPEIREEQPEEEIEKDVLISFEVTVTAYDLSVQSCGKKITHKEYGISRSGVSLRNHTRESAMAIAVDPKVIQLGTRVKLDFNQPEYQKYNGIYNAVDTGRLIKGNKIDLFMGDFGDQDSAKAMRFGITDAKLIILEGDNNY